MILLRQMIELLTEPPGNIVYHLVTLFALQVVLALALNQWRRDRHNEVASRMIIATTLLLTARLGLLFVSLVGIHTILPVLTQAVHTLTAVSLLYAFIPLPTRWPRLPETALTLTLILLTVMTLFFATAWQNQSTLVNYNSSSQATFWGLVQISLLAASLIILLWRRPTPLALPATIMGVMLLTHLLHFWHYPERITTATEIAYWLRLGHLIIFPLWAVHVYQQTVRQLLQQTTIRSNDYQATATTIQLTTNTIASLTLDPILRQGVILLSNLTQATFAGIALLDEDEYTLHLTSNLPQPNTDQPRHWDLSLNHWPSFRLALDEKQTVQLFPNGRGARQLRDLYQELGVSQWGALIIRPLYQNQHKLGLLLLSAPQKASEWPPSAHPLLTSLGDYITQLITNQQIIAEMQQQIANLPLLSQPNTEQQGQLIHLETQNKQLQQEQETLTARLQQAEKRLQEATQKSHDLAATITALEQRETDEMVALQNEIETLRQSLNEAEDALALASAAEGGLSTEWVMQAISRYSSELEEAQRHIQALTQQQQHIRHYPHTDTIQTIIEEMQTHMTAISSYTELLLIDEERAKRPQQLLRYIQGESKHLHTFIEQLRQLSQTNQEQITLPASPPVNVSQLIDHAIETSMEAVQAKQLRLDLHIPPELPVLAVNQQALQQIFNILLQNAFTASSPSGHVGIHINTGQLVEAASNGQPTEAIDYMHVSIQDSGAGLSATEQANLFDAHYRAKHPIIAGLGDAKADLSIARALTEANGGRIWVDSELGEGSTFSILFPIPHSP